MKLSKHFTFAMIKQVCFVFILFAVSSTAQSQTFSLFSPGGIIGGPGGGVAAAEGQDNDPLVGIEVGFKFKVSQIGTLNSIRFYKYSGNGNATYRANLWANTGGSALSTATAVISGAGWKTIDIPDYVLLPGTVYVISVYSPTGYYSVDIGYFPANTDQSVPPFIIVANNNDPVGNGVYSYGSSSLFPIASFNSSNYWVDPVFTTLFTLPVSLNDFRATTSNSDVVLNWKTAYEYQNRGFEVQRSNNASEWYTVDFVKSSGDASVTSNYSYTDKALAPGTYYYRLKQNDLDGKSTVSAVVNAVIGGKGKTSLFQNFPNPFSGTTTIRFDLPRAQQAKLSVVDMTGREVKVLANGQQEAGSHLVKLDAGSLAHQVYIVRLQTEEGILTNKIQIK